LGYNNHKDLIYWRLPRDQKVRQFQYVFKLPTRIVPVLLAMLSLVVCMWLMFLQAIYKVAWRHNN